MNSTKDILKILKFWGILKVLTNNSYLTMPVIFNGNAAFDCISESDTRRKSHLKHAKRYMYMQRNLLKQRQTRQKAYMLQSIMTVITHKHTINLKSMLKAEDSS